MIIPEISNEDANASYTVSSSVSIYGVSTLLMVCQYSGGLIKIVIRITHNDIHAVNCIAPRQCVK